MTGNALIRRYRFSVLRPAQVWIFAAVYGLAAAVVVMINSSLHVYQQVYAEPRALFEALFYQFLVIEFLMLAVWAPGNTYAALRDEFTGKTIDFFRMLPLSAASKAFGILVGKNLLVLGLAAINGALLGACGWLGHVPGHVQAQLVALILAIALLANLVALLSSTRFKPRRRSGRAGLLLLILFGVPYVIGGIVHLADGATPWSRRVAFYTLQGLLLPTLAAVAVYFSVWTGIGVLRRFRHEREPLFTACGARLFMLGLCALVLGFFWPHLFRQGADAGIGFWVLTALPLLLIPFGFLRSAEWYQETLSRESRPLAALWRRSNLGIAAGCFAIWAAAAVVGGRAAALEPGLMLKALAVFLCFYAFLVLLLELHVVLARRYGKLGVLLGVIAALYMVLPAIMSPILDAKDLHMYTPPGFIAALFSVTERATIPFSAIIAVHGLLCLPPATSIIRRYRALAGAPGGKGGGSPS